MEVSWHAKLRPLTLTISMVGHPSPGRGPLGRAPGWVPGAHKSRLEAQGRRGKRPGERAPTGGDTEIGARSKKSVPQYIIRGFGVQEGEIQRGTGRGTTFNYWVS